MCKIGYFLVLCVWNLVCVMLGYAWLYFIDDMFKFQLFVLNFEGAFFGFVLIGIANFFSLKRRIDNQIKDWNTLQQSNKHKKRYFSKFILGLHMSMSLSRILAYGVFCVILWFLMSKGEFLMMAFVFGIVASLLGIVALQILKEIKTRV